MKNILLIYSVIIFVCPATISQVPKWQWANNYETATGGGVGRCITHDANGFIYAAGLFRGPLIVFGNDTLTVAGTYGFYLAKFDVSGNVVWATGASGNGGSSGADPYAIHIDGSGNLYLAGDFSCYSLTFGSTVLTNANTNNSSDIFIAKYNTSGTLLSAIKIGGDNSERVTNVASDAIGNIYLTGSFSSHSIKFGTKTLTNITPGYFDLFLVKYNSAGNVVWARKAGGTGHDDCTGICVDLFGGIYITGWFRSPTIDFGTTTLTNPSGWNYGYITKYDSVGKVIWVKRAGDVAFSIFTDGLGNIYATGEYSGNFTFDSITLIPPPGATEMFVVKYDLSGNVKWAKSSYGIVNGKDRGYTITNDSKGNVFVSGIFDSDSLLFQNSTVFNFDSSGNYDFFIAKYDSSGNVLWARGVGGDATDACYGMTVDLNGNIFLTGYFASSTIAFDSIHLSVSYGSAFIAKLGNSSTGIHDLFSDNSQINIHPNPLNTSTTILFSITKPQNLSIKIFDINGRLVSTLADKFFEAGENEIVWDAEKATTGIYFLLFQSAETLQTEKLIVTK